MVVHPDGAVSGPPPAVAAEVGRLAARDRQGDLDRQAAWTIQRLLTGDGPARASPNSGGAVAFSTSNPWSRHDGPPLAVQLR